MLIWAHKMAELNFESLMQVYWEGNRDNGMRFYTHLEQDQAHKRAEQDFYNYLADDFFAHRGARYAIWAEKEQYICALRLEPWEDGLLLQALETHPDHRRRGYAKQLITETKANYPHLLANESVYMSFLGAVSAVPTTFFVRQDGSLIGYLTGALEKENWKALIDDLLSEEQ